MAAHRGQSTAYGERARLAEIEAPRHGFLVINPHSESSNYTESDYALCGIGIDNSRLPAGSFGAIQHGRAQSIGSRSKATP